MCGGGLLWAGSVAVKIKEPRKTTRSKTSFRNHKGLIIGLKREHASGGKEKKPGLGVRGCERMMCVGFRISRTFKDLFRYVDSFCRV